MGSSIGDTRTYWTYVKLKEPQVVRDKIYYAMKGQEAINCTKRTFRPLIVQLLDSQGSLVSYADTRANPSDMPIPPDTMMDLELKYVCSIKKSAE
jgi:hypothetical protein